MRWVIAVGLLAGCYSPSADPACSTTCNPANAGIEGACPSGLTCRADGKCHGASICGLVDASPNPDGMFCYGTGIVKICFTAQPTGNIPLTGVLDTDTCVESRSQDAGPDVCVVAGDSVTLRDLSISGSRPAVIIAVHAMQLQGTIDVAAGANDTNCAPLVTIPMSGGHGGTFRGSGGAGGGTKFSTTTVIPTALRGGCPGGPSVEDAPGGKSGGAVFLIADAINVGSAHVNASGYGGGTSVAAGGGGGGGTGGMIGLDAPLITVEGGSVFANGGGGGGGGAPGATTPGRRAASFDETAGGGLGQNNNNGGDGGGVTDVDGKDGTRGEGAIPGGGGGGGAGVIVIYPLAQSDAFMNAVSPPAIEL